MLKTPLKFPALILPLIAFLLVPLRAEDSLKIFTDVRKLAATDASIKQEFIDPYLAEILDVYNSKNPTIDPSIKYIFVLSGRNTYLGNPVDIPLPKDSQDDYHRINLAIEVARKVAAIKCKKSPKMLTDQDILIYGPQIIYNGTPKHNDEFKQALNSGNLNHYPKEKFLIFELDPNQLSTKGQMLGIKKELPIHHSTVVVVTHAYHFPRVSRMLGRNAPLYPFGQNVKVYVHLVDRELTSPGIEDNLVSEIARIPKYIEKRDLEPNPAKEITWKK